MIAASAGVLGVLCSLAALIAVLVVGIRWHEGRVMEAWEGLGRRLGLTYMPGDVHTPRQLSGEVDGVPVLVIVRNPQDLANPGQRARFTRVQCTHGLDLGVGLLCTTKQASFLYTAAAMKLDPVSVARDGRSPGLMPHAHDPAGATRWLTPEAREALTRADAAAEGVVLDDTSIFNEWVGELRDDARLERIIRAQVSAVQALRAAWR